RQKAQELLDEVGLADRGHHKPGQLSGGEQQRVAVARALVGRPSLLLGDEPTGNLDEHTSEAIFQLLLEVHRTHRLTSIIVTHNPRLAALCELEKRLQEGKLVNVTSGN
ncbi:MAG: ATP-binding cassette domain-containing protein, partial [Acidobacteriota bacterium]